MNYVADVMLNSIVRYVKKGDYDEEIAKKIINTLLDAVALTSLIFTFGCKSDYEYNTQLQTDT